MFILCVCEIIPGGDVGIYPYKCDNRENRKKKIFRVKIESFKLHKTVVKALTLRETGRKRALLV